MVSVFQYMPDQLVYNKLDSSMEPGKYDGLFVFGGKTRDGTY